MGRLPFSYALRSVAARRVRTMLTVAVIALVVLAVSLMMSLASGIRSTLVATGSADNLIVLRKGATSDGSSMIPIEAFQAVRYFAGIARDARSDEPLVSPETVVQPFFYPESGGRENVLVRGVTPMAFVVHEQVKIVEGRTLRPGLGEIVVGKGLLARYSGLRPGQEFRFGQRDWTVVGIFEAGGSSFESEVWADAKDLWTDANRSIYSGLRVRVAPGTDREALIRRIEADGRWALTARPETEYYEEQGESADFLYGLTVILAVLMGLGAVFGAMNTMFAAVQSRTAEIGTLRALGFPRSSILFSFVGESTIIGLAGFVFGMALSLIAMAVLTEVLHGIAFNLSTFSTAVVSLRLTLDTALVAFVLATALGFFGGLVPARRASSMSPAEALRKG